MDCHIDVYKRQAKWLAKGAENSNLYLRNGVRVIMMLTIPVSYTHLRHCMAHTTANLRIV